MKKDVKMFGMIGSYVGLIVGLVGAYFSLVLVLYLVKIGELSFFVLLIPLVPPIVGFWIGCAVQIFINKKFK